MHCDTLVSAYIPHTQILEPLFENTLENKIFGQDIALDPSFSNVAQGGLQGCWLGTMKTKCTLKVHRACRGVCGTRTLVTNKPLGCH